MISGCDQQNDFNPDIHKGSQGLVIEVLKNSPPNEVYEGENFKIVARLINKGAYAIKNGILLLTLEKDFVDLKGNERINFNLQGKDPFNSWDDEKIISYDLSAKKLDEMSEKHESVLFLTTCYDYETIASFDICIDTNPYNKKSTAEPIVCQAKALSSSGQGSPIVVTTVEQDISEETDYIRPMFNIYIQNKGEGDTITPGSEELVCSSGKIDKENFNRLELTDVEFSTYKKSNGQITCSPQIIKMDENQAEIRCIVNSGLISKNNPSYQTTLKIHLRYGYTETKVLDLDIKNDPAYDEETETESLTQKTTYNYGTKYGSKCNTPYQDFDCYDLSNNAVCPSGYYDKKGYCPGSSDIRCCVK